MATYISMIFSITSPATTLILPITGFSGEIDWGNGIIQTYTNQSEPSSIYQNVGTYNVSMNFVTSLISFGSPTSSTIYKNSLISFSYLINILTFRNLSFLFAGCTQNFTINFNSNVTNNVTNMSYMFFNTSLFNKPITLDCSSCTTLGSFLNGARQFNSSLNLTNTQKVTDMSQMVYGTGSFNQAITLDCSSCLSLNQFLFESTNFNSSLNLTNTQKVINMSEMFANAVSFNRPISLDCSSCVTLNGFLYRASSFNSFLNLTNTQKVTTISNMFYFATAFNQPISLDCSSCTALNSFLYGAASFNSSLNLTNTQKVTNMTSVFRQATSFNQPISLDCSSCTDLRFFLNGATNFNNTLNLTPIPNLTNASNMLFGSDLSTTNYSNLLILWGSQSVQPNVTLTATGIQYNLAASAYRNILVSAPNNWTIDDGGPATTYISMRFSITSPNTTLTLPITGFSGEINWGNGTIQTYTNQSNISISYQNAGSYDISMNFVTSLTSFGNGNSSYQDGLTRFSYLINIPSLTDLSYLFSNCTQNFTINFDTNVTSNVTNMSNMFYNVPLFNQPINLNCSSCATLQSFLHGATSFNSSFTLTNTQNVTNMSYMFYDATTFNKPIALDCSSCTVLERFLFNATSFNSSFTLTNTQKVTNMSYMFLYATSFNQPITLDCSSCTTLESFLDMATNFNSSLTLTNTQNVTNMSYMFYDATSFNQPISLNCSSCTTLQSFLYGATNFNNTLNLTPIPNLTNASNMLFGSDLSTTNYSNLLILWGSQSVQPNVTLTATGITYNPYAEPYRNILVSAPNNWTIDDGGLTTTYIAMRFLISPSRDTPNTTLTLPITGFTGEINWGDGTIQTYVDESNVSNSYQSSGFYDISMNFVTSLTSFGSEFESPLSYNNGLTRFSYLINIPNLTNLSYLFSDCRQNFTINFDTNITSNVTNMSGMFYNTLLFDQPINLNCSSCTTLEYFLSNAKNFNNSLNLTNTQNVTNMSSMFSNAPLFNQSITLDCSSCTTLEYFLFESTNFNSSLNLTNTQNVTNMSSMFYTAISFNKSITLDCSSCTTLKSFLSNATNFNNSLNLTNTQNVTNMSQMFQNAVAFNQSITLDCSSCVTLNSFLFNATSFNSSLNLTNTQKVINMSFMFYNAITFNKSITLDCSSCTTLESFLDKATSFNSSLNLTPIPNLTNAFGMILDTSLSTTNYSNLLILWGSQHPIKPSVPLTATGIKYNSSAIPYRNALVSSPNNWTITDGGADQITTIIDVSSNITKNYGSVPFQYTYSSNNPTTPIYSSSNISVATIDPSGIITMLSSGTSTLTISQSATSNYTDGSSNSILTVQSNNNLNPLIITTGYEMEYFLTTNTVYGMIGKNITVTDNLVNQGNNVKIITSEELYQIHK